MKTGALLSGLILLSCAFDAAACGHAVSQCSVVVESDKFTASFPVLVPTAQWRWKRRETPINGMEYRWLVELGRCGDNGQFERLEFTLSVEVFRWKDSVEQTGSLTDLLAAAQYDVSKRTVQENGAVVYDRLNQLHLSAASYVPTMIAVTSTQKETLDTLFGERPSTALMTAYIPDKDQSYQCTTDIVYK